MSSNDIIHIKRNNKGYLVTYEDVEGGSFYSGKKLRNLEEAVLYAEELQNEESPEYGIQLHIWRMEEI